jgi:tellurite resistance protein TerA
VGLFTRASTTEPTGEASKPDASVAPAAVEPVAVGTVSLTKLSRGQGISLVKTPLLTATVSWPSVTDYDVYALVRYRNGAQITVSQFGTHDAPALFSPTTPDGAVRHLGDVQRGDGRQATETVEIRLTPEIVAVVPVVYSAQSNGTGSFRRYRASMRIDNGAGQAVEIESANASRDDKVYTCVPGIVLNDPAGLRVEALELYSARGSEHRPIIDDQLRVLMDAGPVNAYK